MMKYKYSFIHTKRIDAKMVSTYFKSLITLKKYPFAQNIWGFKAICCQFFNRKKIFSDKSYLEHNSTNS